MSAIYVTQEFQDEYYPPEKTSISKNARLRDPYGIKNPIKKLSITPKSFCDARIYDKQIIESGWNIQYGSAKRKFQRYVNRERRNDKYFKRPMTEVSSFVQDEEGNTIEYIDLVPVNYKVTLNNTGPNSQRVILPQARDGVSADDPAYVPRMFTARMGANVAKRRTELGMKQSDLAKRLNVDEATIRNIEKGDKHAFNPENALTLALARALNLPSIKYVE